MITPSYAAILGILFILLSAKALLRRRTCQVAVGNGDDVQLLRAVRVHGNFAEYVPITLFMIYLLETLGGAGMLIHGLCLLLIVGRISHAYGVSQENENFRFRVFGMALTFTSLGSACLGLLLIQ